MFVWTLAYTLSMHLWSNFIVIYKISNHVMWIRTRCNYSIILMVVRYMQCINNIKWKILESNLYLNAIIKCINKKLGNEDHYRFEQVVVVSYSPNSFMFHVYTYE